MDALLHRYHQGSAEQVLLNKTAIRLLNNDRNTALKLLRRVLGINPDNRQAKAALLQIEPVN